jgi:hypothetical protein
MIGVGQQIERHIYLASTVPKVGVDDPSVTGMLASYATQELLFISPIHYIEK